MKNLFALILFLGCEVAAAQSNQCNQKKYSIEIFDYNFSMAYTTGYNIVDDSLIIIGLNGIEGRKDTCLVAKKISEDQSQKVYNFLCSLDIMKLKDKYENPLIDDGDQKMVKICFKNKIKTVEINNIYQKDMANLFDVINQFIGEEYKIRYKTK